MTADTKHVWVVDPSAGSFKVTPGIKAGREREPSVIAKKITKKT